MTHYTPIDLSYFPGCSLDSTATENSLSLLNLFNRLGYNLLELDDWNCCGSSSAHSIDSQTAFFLETRNLSLAPKGRPLLVACPSCLLRLREAQFKLFHDETAQRKYEKLWGKPVDRDLTILHFFDLLDGKDLLNYSEGRVKRLEGLRFVSYYGCMLSCPPALRHQEKYYGLMEKILASLGAESLTWSNSSRCCGTFHSIARPQMVKEMVNEINHGAQEMGADCIVTACAMCHLNLEIRCTLKQKIPALHFSEILALGLGSAEHKQWFSRHLVDPRPVLKSRGVI